MTLEGKHAVKGHILFVEDFADTRALISYVLEGADYQVTPAGSMRQCLELAAAQSFDLFLLNHVLPDGSGITLCRHLRELYPTTPIVMFSAAAHPAEMQAGLEAGADEYLVKPNDLFNIPTVVDRLLDGTSSQSQRLLGHMMAVLSQENLTEADAHFALEAQRFVELFQGLPVACFVFNRQGHIVEWNRVCEFLYGRRAEDVLLQPVGDVITCLTAQGYMEGIVSRVLDGTPVEGQEVIIQRPDGQERAILSNSFPLFSPQGEVLGGINASMDITRRKQQEEQLKQLNTRLLALAMTDGLTSLKNHRAFKERLSEEFTRATRYNTPLSLILLDVDKFKDYNDAFGHPAGDEVLKTISRRLQETARESDAVARYGGEEFAILLPHTDADASRVSAERFRTAIEQTPWPKRPVTASLGIATLTAGITEPAALLSAADRALYISKADGRNRATHVQDLS